MSYVLFYSNYCKFSEKFISILEKTGEANFFVKICVDKSQSTGKRHELVSRYRVSEVPSIVVEGKLLAGREAFGWLKSRIDRVSQEPPGKFYPGEESRNNRPEINIRTSGSREMTNMQESIRPFFEGGTSGGIADSCVVIGDTGDTSIYTPQDDSEVSRESKFGLKSDCLIPGPDVSEEKSSVKDSLKSKQFENEYNRLLQERQK
jgi:hypothetical protein